MHHPLGLGREPRRGMQPVGGWYVRASWVSHFGVERVEGVHPSESPQHTNAICVRRHPRGDPRAEKSDSVSFVAGVFWPYRSGNYVLK
eukprot:564428-Pyramimonas_sp.AAC.1